MDKASALAALRDIHLPKPIGWWPPAIGWILLALITLICIVGLVTSIIRYVLNSRTKRKALCVLASYQKAYLREKNTQVTSARVSELLKRVALVYYPRESVASLVGDAWIKFLNETGKKLDFRTVSTLLTECPYRRSMNHDLTPLFNLAHQWIKQRRGSCSK